MKDEVKMRAKIIGEYIASTRCTVRKAAKIFEVSKSTVHSDVSVRLKKIDGVLYEDVKKILTENFKIKHIRGGESTRKKYREQKR